MTIERDASGDPDTSPAGEPATSPAGEQTGAPDTARSRRMADRVLANPFVGFAPWIVLALLEGPGQLVLATSLALALSLVVLVHDIARGRSIKILAVVDVVAFAAFGILALLAGPTVTAWLETWSGEVANLVLVVVVGGSMLARVPFTVQYAREETPARYWATPLFLRVNYVITGVWGLAFLVSSAAGFYGDAVLHDADNVWTGWVIQIVATLIAVRFTGWYPDHATARAARIGAVPRPR